MEKKLNLSLLISEQTPPNSRPGQRTKSASAKCGLASLRWRSSMACWPSKRRNFLMQALILWILAGKKVVTHPANHYGLLYNTGKIGCNGNSRNLLNRCHSLSQYHDGALTSRKTLSRLPSRSANVESLICICCLQLASGDVWKTSLNERDVALPLEVSCI